MEILYATDGSEYAARAGRLLAALPLPADTRITVLSVVPKLNWLDSALLAEGLKEEEAAARSFATAAAAELERHGLKTRVSVRHADPALGILEEAETDGAALIVVGSHGRNAVTRFLLGSVSERVSRYAHCPVLVARGDTVQRVIIGVDGSESAEHALDTLAGLPLPAGTELTAVYVLPTSLPWPENLGADVAMETAIETQDRERHVASGDITRRAHDRLAQGGREVRVEVRAGAPGHELITAAKERSADLIVVGAANRSPLGRLFMGSVSGSVLSHALCSVLVTRRAEEEPAPRGS